MTWEFKERSPTGSNYNLLTSVCNAWVSPQALVELEDLELADWELVDWGPVDWGLVEQSLVLQALEVRSE